MKTDFYGLDSKNYKLGQESQNWIN